MTFRISKTTVNGCLAFLIAAIPLAMTNPELHLPLQVMAWLSFLLGLARMGVGLLQTDADTVKVETATGTAAVDAHPVPDSPALQNAPIVKP